MLSQSMQLRLNLDESDDELLATIPVRADRERRSAIGQFMTPAPIADFMASLFNEFGPSVNLLDAGAGAGALTEAFISRLCSSEKKPKQVQVTAIESDETILEKLHDTLNRCRDRCHAAEIAFSSSIVQTDFISATVPTLKGTSAAIEAARYDAAIVNPPYRKIPSTSTTRKLLSSIGIETSNLYSAFVALISRLLLPGGQLVAITPRSFCNGPYFRPFRVDFLAQMSLRRLHVFESRSEIFARDSVLQENIILHAVKGRKPPRRVIISTSRSDPRALVLARGVAYSDVVSPADSASFIRLETDDNQRVARVAMNCWKDSLGDLGISVSTGRVVDFRAECFLRKSPGPGTVPLIYPCHFSQGRIRWPKTPSRKPNAIVDRQETRALLVPSGTYVLVKRFSAKEERRRIVACLFDPADVSSPQIGFENHLNYFHADGRGLDDQLAKGLTAFLNSTIVDTYFREFSGHTQVNAADLRAMKFPPRQVLMKLGRRMINLGIDQQQLDAIIQAELL